jgi:hypothetical protein
LPGQIKILLEQLILTKSLGDPIVAKMTKIKILAKGIRVDDFHEQSEDEPVVIEKITKIYQDFGVDLYGFENGIGFDSSKIGESNT